MAKCVKSTKELQMTREEFAKYSVERDVFEGCFNEWSDIKVKTFDDLSKDEQSFYLQEADYYLTLPLSEWPLDILERMTNPT